MGIYLNPGKESFEMALKSEIFVDKTDMILFLNSVTNTKQRYLSVSRPRRFGKSMAADMICAYYDREADSRKLFETRKLAADRTVQQGGACQDDRAYQDDATRTEKLPWDAYLGQFDVIRIVMTDFVKKNIPVEKSLDKLQRLVVRDIKKKYPDADYFDDTDLIQSMADAYESTERQFVIVIDEWDAVFRVCKEDKDGQTRYLDFLRDWLKDKPYVALAYMTGILPIKKYGEHSALNMFMEYSMIAPKQLASFTGFTEDEVQELCTRYRMRYEDISSWYDGYEVSDIIPVEERERYRQSQYKGHKISIYSPLSVVNAVSTGVIRNYWNKTETYEALAEYIRRDYDGLKEAVALLMDGGRLRIDTSTYQNDMTTFHGRDDVLSLLIHLGYLGFDDERSEVFIPNREILDEFKASTKSEEWVSTFQSFEISQELLKATWEADADKVAELVERAHDRAGNKTYHDEAALSYAIQYAYYAAQKYYTTILELDTGKGYADVVYLPSPKYPDKPALLIELKYNKDADTALSQIRRQEYDSRMEHYKGNILLVAINYDKGTGNESKEFKHYSCLIERA